MQKVKNIKKDANCHFNTDTTVVHPVTKEKIDEEIHELKYKKDKIFKDKDTNCYRVEYLWHFLGTSGSIIGIYNELFYNIDAIIDFFTKISNDLLNKNFKKWLDNFLYVDTPSYSPEKNIRVKQEREKCVIEHREEMLNKLNKILLDDPNASVIRITMVIYPHALIPNYLYL